MNDLDNLLIYAARYAHNRKTGAANQVVNIIINNWDDIGEKTRVQLAKEASNEATTNLEDWERLINLHNGSWD